MNAHLHLTGGKIAEAEKALVSLRNPDSAPSFIHFLRGQIFKQHGQLDRAFEELVRAQPGPWTYRCRACGHAAGDCPGRCSACGGWDSHRAAVEIGAD
jgi:rubrerythrin